nr:DUF3040 domain-containing protein [Kibdelosporangium sp. MJ126-NF4]CEL17570.1 hypothetical protein [Kibdelosporangium sp. MJ126-NF4]CTQ91203.1 hypothetical protein [Kibdelosporangium sp. MJ126-NF4]
MLSDHEKRQLRLIEQQLEQETPNFAYELRTARSRPPLLGRVWPYVSTVLFGLVLFVLGCLVGSVLLLLVGVACGALVLVTRTLRRHGIRQSRRH